MASIRLASVSAVRHLPCKSSSRGALTCQPFFRRRDSIQATTHRPAASRRNLFHTTSLARSQAYNFDDVKSFAANPSPERVLVDVREPGEYEAGYIPGAVNMPISSSPDALFMPADEFEEKFGIPKPKAEQEVVFYCKAGVRSRAAAKLAEQVGYKKVGEYGGSWMDWVKNGGHVEK